MMFLGLHGLAVGAAFGVVFGILIGTMSILAGVAADSTRAVNEALAGRVLLTSETTEPEDGWLSVSGSDPEGALGLAATDISQADPAEHEGPRRRSSSDANRDS